MTEDLSKWVNNNYTHPGLAYCIPKYILLRGAARLCDFPQMSPAMATVARSQDLILWTAFMERKLSHEIFRLQNLSLACSPSRLSTLDWSKKLISQILHINYAQWIFRNLSLHHNIIGYLRLTQRRKVLAEFDRLSQLDLAVLPEESKYLLEIDFSSLKNDNLVSQSYWLFAIKAAKTAGQRALVRLASYGRGFQAAGSTSNSGQCSPGSLRYTQSLHRPPDTLSILSLSTDTEGAGHRVGSSCDTRIYPLSLVHAVHTSPTPPV